MNIQNITVDEFTTPSPISVRTNETLESVWAIMQENGIRHVLVSENDQIVGILSERDLTTFSQAEYFKTLQAKDVMSKDLITVTPDAKLFEVALNMSEKKIGSTVVQDENSDYLGIFTSTDALNALVEVLRGDLN